MTTYSNLAVFTGDIVKSTSVEASVLDEAFAAVKSICDWFGTARGTAVWFSRFRGDGWQITVEDSIHAPVLLPFIWSKLAEFGLRSRLAIAVGAGTIAPDDLGASHGPAFLASGQALEGLDRDTLAITDTCPLAWRTTFPMMEFVANGWTNRQAAVFGHALRHWPEDSNMSALARTLDMSRQNVQKHLDSAGFGAFEATLSAIVKTH